jgi:hypothetical protein
MDKKSSLFFPQKIKKSISEQNFGKNGRLRRIIISNLYPKKRISERNIIEARKLKYLILILITMHPNMLNLIGEIEVN